MYKVLVTVHSHLTCSHLLADISLFKFNNKFSFTENVSVNVKKKKKGPRQLEKPRPAIELTRHWKASNHLSFFS